jgi:beta-phosphoglucomutase-like phosphatase (HAD superfamily)
MGIFRNMSQLEAVVFDMDGVLIDSEPLWRKAEIAVMAQYGIYLTEADCIRLMGLRTDEVVQQIAIDFGQSLDIGKVSQEIIESVCRLIKKDGLAIQPFCELALDLKNRQIPLAVATSSPMQVVEAVLERTGLTAVFNTLVSAERFPFGKPHPQVYIEACAGLQIPATNCLAIEDSLNGTLAAKAARMKVLSVPEKEAMENKAFGIADYLFQEPTEACNFVRSLFS